MADFLSSTARRVAVVLFAEAIAAVMAAGPPAGAAIGAYAALSRPSKCGAAQVAGKQFVKGVTPVLFVHGFNSGPAMWTGDEAKVEGSNKTLVDLVSETGSTTAFTFDYRSFSNRWVTDRAIGHRLADTISCLRNQADRRVILVAHSMGGLAAQWAASDRGGRVGRHITAVVTLGTPYKGSWLAECTLNRALDHGHFRECGEARKRFMECDETQRRGEKQPVTCRGVPSEIARKSKAVEGLANKNSEITNLVPWPSKGGPNVYPLAGKAEFKTEERKGEAGLFGVLAVAGIEIGDKVVSMESATNGGHIATVDCEAKDPQKDTCFHTMLHRNDILARTVVGRIKIALQREEEQSTPKRVDLSRQRITVNGMGPLKFGMSRAQAEKAIGARIPGTPNQAEPFGRPCRDLTVKDGPKGMFLRFSRDELVTIRVSSAASTSISTASGIHRGSPRSVLLRTYAAEITTTSVDNGSEELLFEPSAPKFGGRVIQFSVRDGRVDAFAAGERFFADNLDCSSD
ncbi:esterase/lipase family protein [Streptomyces maoxianensis]|uniref:Esterase/lipase family protein n=1 Tax=Streptomyces maoxianensis TaxID=1459942 RepID=A0ABV9GAB6_9ACTN